MLHDCKPVGEVLAHTLPDARVARAGVHDDLPTCERVVVVALERLLRRRAHDHAAVCKIKWRVALMRATFSAIGGDARRRKKGSRSTAVNVHRSRSVVNPPVEGAVRAARARRDHDAGTPAVGTPRRRRRTGRSVCPPRGVARHDPVIAPHISANAASIVARGAPSSVGAQ